ncbi:helix-turn-helix domain-containing protein [Actinoplanes nipponensis]|nr:XRE family transcriptional regulator [Actinoplanes nipponensis]
MGQQDWSDVGDRVQAARTAAGMSQGELADAIGLDRTMVAKIESGARRVDALELARLAATLRVPMAHFLEAQPVVLSRRAVALTNDTDSEAGRESNLLDVALEGWIRELRQLIGLGLLTPGRILAYPSPVASADDARRAARWLRDKLGAGSEPVDSLVRLCQQAGQYVLVTELRGDGASAVDGDLGAAVVSSKGDPGRRRATAAHELGHLVLGDEYSSDIGVHASRAEREAIIDAFAAEVLLPIATFPGADRSGAVSRDQLLHLAATYRTSWSLTIKQAEAAGLDVPKRWARTNPTKAEFLEALGWTPQPDLESVRVPPAFAHAVMQAWRTGRITRRRAVELMHGQIQEGDLPPEAEADLAP